MDKKIYTDNKYIWLLSSLIVFLLLAPFRAIDFPGAEFQVSDQPELREAVSQGWPVGEESRCQNQNCCESHFGRKQPAMDDSANVSSSHTFPRTHRLTTKLADSLPARETHTTSRNHARLDGFRLAGLRRARFSQLRTVSDPQLPVSG